MKKKFENSNIKVIKSDAKVVATILFEATIFSALTISWVVISSVIQGSIGESFDQLSFSAR